MTRPKPSGSNKHARKLRSTPAQMTAPAAGKRPVGRPSLYSPEMVARAAEYVENPKLWRFGVPQKAELANLLGVARSTVDDWAANPANEEFSYMVERLMATQEAMCVGLGLFKQMDSSMARFILSKHGYSANSSVALENKDGKPIKSSIEITPDMSPEEAIRRYRLLLMELRQPAGTV
jgi:hypothetical protein